MQISVAISIMPGSCAPSTTCHWNCLDDAHYYDLLYTENELPVITRNTNIEGEHYIMLMKVLSATELNCPSDSTQSDNAKTGVSQVLSKLKAFEDLSGKPMEADKYYLFIPLSLEITDVISK